MFRIYRWVCQTPYEGMETLRPETSQLCFTKPRTNKSSCRVREGHRWKGGIRLALCRHQMQRTAAMTKRIKGLLHEGAANTMHRCVNHRHGFGHGLLPQNAGLSIQHTTITTYQGFSRPPLPSVLLSGRKKHIRMYQNQLATSKIWTHYHPHCILR